MTYRCDVFSMAHELVGYETVEEKDFMRVFGTLEPTDDDFLEAGVVLRNYYNGFSFEWAEEV